MAPFKRSSPFLPRPVYAISFLLRITLWHITLQFAGSSARHMAFHELDVTVQHPGTEPLGTATFDQRGVQRAIGNFVSSW
jgi:hypothetical protein